MNDRAMPERPQPQRPKGFGQYKPTSSEEGAEHPPQRYRPDVFVDAHAHVGRIEFTLDDLEAHVRLHAQVLDLLALNVGADAALGHIGLVIDDIQVDALVEVRLDAVEAIVVRLIEAIDNNPEIIRDLTRGVGQAVEKVGEGAGKGVERIGEGVGSGADEALGGVGEGVSELGRGAGKGVEGLGQGAGEGVKGLGEGAGEGVKGVGRGVEGLTNKEDSDGGDRQGDREGSGDRRGSDRGRKQRDRNRDRGGERHQFEGHGGYRRR